MLGCKKRSPTYSLLTVEAERFIAALTRDRFDYTEWRKTGLPDLDIETLSPRQRTTPIPWITDVVLFPSSCLGT